jgi:hypothetical protein
MPSEGADGPFVISGGSAASNVEAEEDVGRAIRLHDLIEELRRSRGIGQTAPGS